MTKRELRLVGSGAVQRAPEAPRVADRPVMRKDVFALVHRQMLTLAGRSQDFEDLVQIAAEQVFLSLHRFEGRSAPATWTYRICYHTLLKQRRWYRRWLRRFVLAADDVVPDLAAMTAGPDDLIEQQERAARLRAAMERLSPKRRAVVALHDLDELAVEEIAAIVGANVHTVRSRLRDGRRLLAEYLAEDAYFGDEPCGMERK